MARRQLLTREALGSHYDPPTDEREIARHFTLSREDLDLVSERRGAPSRLGFALLLLWTRAIGDLRAFSNTRYLVRLVM